MDKKKFATDALFIGPKSENASFLTKTLIDFIQDHLYWRKDYHPDDEPIITLEQQSTTEFRDVWQRTINSLDRLSAKMRQTSPPWQSPRYLGHMNSEVLMPSILGYVTAMLYNLNNCSYEGSPATTPMELEVGLDFCRLLGFDPNKAWGHISCDGTIANIEGLWYARNLKSIPFGIKKVSPELVNGKTDWELSNMTISEILDLSESVQDNWAQIEASTVRGKGISNEKLGKWIVPQSKHYSWNKAVDLLGIGSENMIEIQVDDKFRIDIDKLETVISDLADQKIPILGVVGVIGTTEEGSIDQMNKIVALRKKFEEERGVTFFIHADAAYGGYARTIFLDEDNNFIPYDELCKRLVDDEIFDESINWPTREVYESFKALKDVDSITIDPHKMGYVPYAAGGIVIKDKRMVAAISFFASYVFDQDTQQPASLGSYILEGSKAGASAAAVWMAHQVIPLNITGYGRLIGASIYGAHKFYNLISRTKEFDIQGVTIKMEALSEPDFNIVNWAYNIKGNENLEKMDLLNSAVFKMSTPIGELILKTDFLTSHTTLDYSTYKDAPAKFAESLGIPRVQWDNYHKMVVLRACVMTPYFMNPKVLYNYWETFMESMKKKLEKILNRNDLELG